MDSTDASPGHHTMDEEYDVPDKGTFSSLTKCLSYKREENKDGANPNPNPDPKPNPKPNSNPRPDTGRFSSPYVPDKYNMNHKHRGIAVIINNVHFDKNTGLETRHGSDVDAQGMKQLLSLLGFQEIRYFKNATAREMTDAIDKESREDHSNYDCFLCVVLSHGEKGGLIWGKDDTVALDDLMTPMKNVKSLAGKPKIYFVQACRGDLVDQGLDMPDYGGMECDTPADSSMYKIPTGADFFTAYSVIPGHSSFRRQSGSWFIQATCDVITAQWQTTDLLTMMTRVSKKVAYDYQSKSKDKETRGFKQIPCVVSMLTKDVFF